MNPAEQKVTLSFSQVCLISLGADFLAGRPDFFFTAFFAAFLGAAFFFAAFFAIVEFFGLANKLINFQCAR